MSVNQAATTAPASTAPTNPSAAPVHRTNAPGHDKFGSLPNSVLLHPSRDPSGPPLSFHDILGRPPTVRQWFEGGTLYREGGPRVPARVETFFDLVFIGLINKLASAVIEEPGGDAIARFILTFHPAWTLWFEARRYANVLGSDDIMHRAWVLVAMLAMVGYIGNASAIVLHPVNGAEKAFSNSAVRATVTFWLVARLMHASVIALAGARLPKFRISMWMWAVRVFVPMFIYLPLVWVTSRTGQVVIAAVAMFVDILPLEMLLFPIVGPLVEKRMARNGIAGGQPDSHLSDASASTANEDDGTWAKEKNLAVKTCSFDTPPPGMRYPAINIEHAVVRMGGFLGLIFGTTIMAYVYTATQGQVGASDKWGKSCLGIMVAFGLNLIYGFPMERIYKFQHALRRSWWTAHMFLFLHWPLCASAILANAAAGRLSNLDTVPAGFVWYWGCGLGFTLLFMAVIAMLHKDLRDWRATRIPRPARFGVGLAASLVLILSPLAADKLSPTAWLALGVGMVWAVVVVEVYGSLPSKWAVKEGQCY